jgi:hypothetical protein
MKLRYLVCAAGALVLTGVPAIANAQDASTSASTWTTANVDAANPFGSIDTSTAGSTASDVGTFAAGLTGQQVIELLGRCNVVLGSTGGMGNAAFASNSAMGGAGTVGSGNMGTDQTANDQMAATSGSSADQTNSGTGTTDQMASSSSSNDQTTSGSSSADQMASGSSSSTDQMATDDNTVANAQTQGGTSGTSPDITGSVAAGSTYGTDATQLCRNLNAAVFGTGMGSEGTMGTDDTMGSDNQ